MPITLSKTTVASISIFVTCLISGLSTYNYTDFSGDLAEYLNNPLRIINGDLPYKDFWLLFPPGEVYLPALLYTTFGLNINLALLIAPVSNAVLAVLAFLIGIRLYDNVFSSLTVSLLIFFILGFKGDVPFPHYIFIFLSVLLFLHYVQRQNARYIVFTGISLAFSYLFRFHLSLAINIAIVTAILITDTLFSKHTTATTVKSIFFLCLGPILACGIVSLIFLDIWPTMSYAVIFDSVAHGTSMTLPYLTSVPFSKPISFDFLLQFVYHLLPLIILPFSLFTLVSAKYRGSEKTKTLPFVLWALFALPITLGRSDIAHLVDVLIPLFFLVISFSHLAKNIYVRRFFQLLVVILVIQIPISISDTVAHMTKRHPMIDTNYGRIFMREPVANTTNEIVRYIAANTTEDDYIFVTSFWSPAFYVLTNRKNPTYYDSLIDVVSRPSEQKQLRICHDLVTKKTKLIVHSRRWGFDRNENLQFAANCQILQKCIEDNFKKTSKIGRYLIYEQR